MKLYIHFLVLQLKTAFKLVPQLCLIFCLFAGIIAGAVWYGSKSLYSDPNQSKIKLAVVLPKQDLLTALSFSIIEKDESIKEICSFVKTDEKTALSMLKNGEVYAALIVPDQMLADILNGTNTPITICFPSNMEQGGAETLIFQTLADAGFRTLATAQSAIYAVDDVLIQTNRSEYINPVQDEINAIFLSYGLERTTYFDETTISAIGSLTTFEFYIVSGIILLLLLSGCACLTYYQSDSKTLLFALNRAGIGSIWITIAKILALTAVQTVFASILYWITKQTVSIFIVIGLFLFIGQIQTFIQMIFRLANHLLSSILLLCSLSVVMLFCSGGIIPSPMLPPSVSQLGSYLPTKYFMTYGAALFTNEINGSILLEMLLFTFIFLGLCIGIEYIIFECSNFTYLTRIKLPKVNLQPSKTTYLLPLSGLLCRVYLLGKRQIKHPSFFLLCIAMPLILWTAHNQQKEETASGFQIAIFCENPDQLTEAIINDLTSGSHGLYHFTLFESEEMVKQAVMNETASVGYIFPNNLTEQLDTSQYEDCIKVYSSPSSIFINVVNEVLFSNIFHQYGRYMVDNYLKSSEWFAGIPDDMMIKGLDYYDTYTTGSDVFHAEYQILEADGKTTAVPAAVLFPIRGILAVLLFVSGLLGGILYLKDQKIHLPVPAYIVIAIPVFLFMISSFVTLILTDTGDSWLYELLTLLLYSMCIILFVRIFVWLFPNILALSVSIPFFILGSVLCCPIFINGTDYFPWMNIAEKFFLPYYYLSMHVGGM